MAGSVPRVPLCSRSGLCCPGLGCFSWLPTVPPASRNLARVVETSPAETAVASFLPVLSCDSKQILLHFFKREHINAGDPQEQNQPRKRNRLVQESVSKQLLPDELWQGLGHGEAGTSRSRSTCWELSVPVGGYRSCRSC